MSAMMRAVATSCLLSFSASTTRVRDPERFACACPKTSPSSPPQFLRSSPWLRSLPSRERTTPWWRRDHCDESIACSRVRLQASQGSTFGVLNTLRQRTCRALHSPAPMGSAVSTLRIQQIIPERHSFRRCPTFSAAAFAHLPVIFSTHA